MEKKYEAIILLATYSVMCVVITVTQVSGKYLNGKDVAKICHFDP